MKPLSAGVESNVTVVTPEPTPARPSGNIRSVTDHTAGPRGAAMQWGLASFAEKRPDIFVKLEPAAKLFDSLAIQFAAGTAPHVAMLSQSDFLYFFEFGAFKAITNELAKRDHCDPEDCYFIPDVYTVNLDHSHADALPVPTLLEGDQSELPLQGTIGGVVLNLDLAERAGIQFPSEGWEYQE